MDKSHIPYVIVGCVVFVFVMKALSGLLFVWWDDMFRGKKDKHFDDLDELIEARKLLMKKSEPVQFGNQAQHNQGQKKTKLSALPEETDPASLKRKAILHQIYDLKMGRLKDEQDLDYYARILMLPKTANSEAVKKAYKERAKECHPDRFDLTSFDTKTQEKLKTKIHENFVVIQKAYDYFKKAA
ncbi:MAG: J domain-containing protein [Bacteriovoracaceae bacterium]